MIYKKNVNEVDIQSLITLLYLQFRNVEMILHLVDMTSSHIWHIP